MLCKAVTYQVYRGYHTTMRTSRGCNLSIAHLMEPDWLLLKPENLPDPGAHQLIVSATECKVNKVMVRVNKERSIELPNPRWNI